MKEEQYTVTANEAATAIIPYFLRSLMKLERERQGLSRQSASADARWSTSTWGHLERNTRPIQPHHWMNIAAVLSVSSAREIRRLNAFIGKHPNFWLEVDANHELSICEKALTSPKAIRARNVVSVDLNVIRPALYYELSRYTVEPEEIIADAKEAGFFASVDREIAAPAKSSRTSSPPPKSSAYREVIVRKVNDVIAEEKMQLLERVIDKFEKYSPSELAQAYRHFSLSLKN